MVVTRVLSCTPANLGEAIAEAAAVLRRGGLVAFPTETVYGLGANALDSDAVSRIFAAKGRPANNPLIVHFADVGQVERVAADWPEQAARLAERFWPGPLTLVLPRREGVPDIVTAGGPTVAVRVPAHPVAQALLAAVDLPIAAPSANRSNRLSPTRAEHVLRDLDGLVELILDGGATQGGIESAVLDLTAHPPRLLRPGLIGPAAIEAVIGPVARQASAAQDTTQPLPSPGMLSRHYAPRTPLELAADDAARVKELAAAGLRVGWVSQSAASNPGDGVVQVVLPEDASGYAAQLYAALHELDRCGLDRIVVARPPQGNEWLGVLDRLKRASAKEG